MGEREQAVLLLRLMARRRVLRTAVDRKIRRWFAASQGFRDSDADRFVRDIVPVAQAAQEKSAALTWAYLSQSLTDLTGKRTTGSPELVTGAALRGVDPQEVYRRPFLTVYHWLAKDKSLTEAVTAGERRARTIAATDLQLAETRTASRTLARDRRAPQFFRRKLTSDENCGLCVIASTQRYRKGDLLPIHGGCDCAVELIPDGAPDLVLDPQVLEAAHAAITERFGVSDRGARDPAYRRAVLVREHGELGPVLTVKDHEFTGPDDLTS